MTPVNNLNYDCLAYMFSFFNPKDWLCFSKVCSKWEAALCILWKDSLKLKYYAEFDITVDNINGCPSLITIKEVKEIIEKTGSKLKHVELLIDENEENKEVLCFIGDYLYYMVDKFNTKDLITVMSECSHNLVSMKIEKLKVEDKIIWKELIEKNLQLSTFIAENYHHNNETLFFLPNNLKKLKLKFSSRKYIQLTNQLLDKQQNLTQLHLESLGFNEETFIILSKHEKTLKSLCLDSTHLDSITSLNCEQFAKITKLVNLEKIHLTGYLPVDDKFLLKMLQHFPSISEIKLGIFFVSEKGLAAIMSIPKLKKLSLIDLKDLTEISCPVEMKQLTTFKLDLGTSVKFNFSTFCNAINQMPVLSDLSIKETAHIFCYQTMFKIINLVISRGKYALIKTFNDVNFDYSLFFDDEYDVSDITKVEIFKDTNFSVDYKDFVKSKELCFTLTISHECLSNFIKTYCENKSSLPNCKVFKEESAEPELIDEFSDDESLYYDGDNYSEYEYESNNSFDEKFWF